MFEVEGSGFCALPLDVTIVQKHVMSGEHVITPNPVLLSVYFLYTFY
jgi:hypothetical protein